MKLSRFIMLFLALGGALWAEQPPKIANKEAIVLSPFEVVANTVDFQKWIKLKSPNYVLYTDAREKEATKLIRQMEVQRLVEQTFLKRAPLKLSPVIVVLPTHSSDWKKIENKGSVEWKVAVSAHGIGPSRIISVEYDWEELGTETMRSMASQLELSDLNLRGPAWFIVGVGNFFETTEFDGNEVTIGRESIWTLAVRERGWQPWPDFFAVTHSSPEFTRESLVGRYNGQCAAFVQYLLTNKDPKYAERLLMWSDLLQSGHPPTEADFKEIMGQSWKEWQSTMEHYLAGGQYLASVFTIPPALAQCPIEKVELHAREMRDLFVLAQVLNQDVPASNAALDSILKAGLKTKGLRELLVDACLTRDRANDALEVLRTLMAEGSTNPEVYSTAASILCLKNLPKRSPHGSLGEDGPQIEAWCRHAIEIEPRLNEANEVLAWTLALASKVTTQNTKEITAIYTRMKGIVPLSPVIAALATACARNGDEKATRYLCDLLIKSKYCNTSDREIAETILAELPAKVEPTAPAK